MTFNIIGPRFTPRMRAKSAHYHDLTRPWQWDVSLIPFFTPSTWMILLLLLMQAFSVLDEEQRQENASSRTNKRRRLDVVQVCPDIGEFFVRIFRPAKFRGDMVELLKGPDKGKLGIIKMIVQVG